MIVNERESRHEHVLQVGRQMMTAARTAPKGKGIDIIEVGMVTDQDIVRLSEEMVRYSDESGMKFLLRDAENLQQAEAVIIIGTAQKVQGLNCAIAAMPPVPKSLMPYLVPSTPSMWVLPWDLPVQRRPTAEWIVV